MPKQKIIKVGNSLAVTIPADLVRECGWQAGEEVVIEGSPEYQVMIVKPKQKAKKTYLSPEFFDWLNGISSKYEKAIKELANL